MPVQVHDAGNTDRPNKKVHFRAGVILAFICAATALFAMTTALFAMSGVAQAATAPPYESPNYNTNTQWAKYLAPLSACPDGSLLTDSSSAQVRNVECLVRWARKRAGLNALQKNSTLARVSSLTVEAVRKCGTNGFCTQLVPHFVELAHYNLSDYLGGDDVEGTFLLGHFDYASSRRVMMVWLNNDFIRGFLFSSQAHQFAVSELTPYHWKLNYYPAELWDLSFGV